MTNINAFAREEGNTLHKREQKRYIYSYRHLDSPGRLAADFHVEKDNWVRHILFFFACVCCRKVKALSKTKKERYFPLFVVSLSSA